MAYVNVNHAHIVDLKNYTISNEVCSSTVAMVIVNNDIYCIRSAKPDDTSKKPVVLCKLYNYLTDGSGVSPSNGYSVVKTELGSTAIAMHANSLTYHNHLFYMVTRNSDGNQVMVFDSNGDIKKKLSYSSIFTSVQLIGSINYYRSVGSEDYFLITDSHSASQIRFSEVYISGNVLYNTGNYFVVSIPDSAYATGNDTYFDVATQQLYVTRFKKENGVIKNNLVMQYNLAYGIVNGAIYSSVRTLHAAASNEQAFEIEGLGIYTYNNTSKKIVCSKNKGVQDAVYKLYS